MVLEGYLVPPGSETLRSIGSDSEWWVSHDPDSQDDVECTVVTPRLGVAEIRKAWRDLRDAHRRGYGELACLELLERLLDPVLTERGVR